jgi:hypothetical protein
MTGQLQEIVRVLFTGEFDQGTFLVEQETLVGNIDHRCEHDPVQIPHDKGSARLGQLVRCVALERRRAHSTGCSFSDCRSDLHVNTFRCPLHTSLVVTSNELIEDFEGDASLVSQHD